jgi:hypothetical protein
LALALLALIGVAVLVAAGRRDSQRANRQNQVHPEPLSADEARAILGVGAAANRTEIASAYRRLMFQAHPDLGGVSSLAARLNAARDRLLKQN